MKRLGILFLMVCVISLLASPLFADDRQRIYSGSTGYEVSVDSAGAVLIKNSSGTVTTITNSVPVQLTGGTITTKTDTTNTGTETDTVVWTPSSGNKIILTGISFTSDTATTLLVESGVTAIIPLAECTASGLVVIGNGSPIWKGADDATLTYTVGTAGRHSILMYGYEID